ncbi:MAG: hypothetical protein A2107_09805 [Verrucomicrobia bacterium GWF2_62_7]|nr:MAG: hypothetical protein A2107_09805 [Verrucomicrobia bacterium GWF2_62_7]
MPSIVTLRKSLVGLPSLMLNSTKTKSGRCAITSRPQRNAPRSLPVPPMAALISRTVAFGNVSLNHLNVFTRQPDAAVMLPPK